MGLFALVLVTLIGGVVCAHLQGPVFVEEPPAWLDFTNTTGAIISCSARGSPPLHTLWIDSMDKPVTHVPSFRVIRVVLGSPTVAQAEDGVQVPEHILQEQEAGDNGNREILTNGSLYFPPFGGQHVKDDIHTTTYRCIASNPVGRVVSRECKLRAEVVHSYMATVQNEYTLTGNVAVLKCQVTGGRGQIRVVNWLRHGGGTSQRTVVVPDGRSVLTSAGALHIRAVSPADSAAAFYCQTAHKLTGERRLSAPGRIFLTEADGNMAPRIEHSEPTVRAKVGSQADLVCAAQGSPPPIYRWYKENDGAMIELHTSLTVQPLDSILKLSKIQHEDSGRYVCVASNILGEDRRQVSLVVNTPLVVRIRPHHQVVDGGSTATFNCSVEGGSGGHNLAWLKDGKPVMDEGRLRLLQSGEVLMVHNVKKGDAGMYQCLARSSDETEQSSSQLVLGSLSPELLSTFIEQTVQPGVSVSLSCRSSGTPPPRISWYLDGSSLLPRGGYMLSSFLDSKGDVVSYLNISHTRIQNGGQYTCSARNSVGIAEHSASLNVYGPPSPRPSQNLTAVSGGSMYIQCPIAGYPISSTTWLHRDQPINSKHHLYSNGTLLLKNIDPKSDKGEFSCTVRNQQGQSASNKIYVEVMKPPEIQEFQFPNNLQEGNRAHVSCTVISGDLPIEIMWYKNGGPISQEPDIQEQHHQFVSALLFSNLAARHSGHYTCIARNAAAQANFTAKLVVRVKPTWLIEPMDTAILYHNPALIHCQASGYPPPKINWERSKEDKPGEAVVIERDGHIHMVENGTIIIHSAVLSHKGHYTCEANNGIGTPIRKTIFLMVNVPAYFRIHSVNHSGMAGDSVYLSCEAEGDLPLRITWGDSPRGILPVPHVRHTSTGLVSEIHLTALSSSDAGKYHCSAHNDFGHDSMIINLSVTEVPEVPADLEVTEIGSRWVNIHWAPMMSPNAPVTHYVVQFKEDNSATKWNNLTVSGTIDSTRLGTLLPNTIYIVRVIAVNKVGLGPPSDVISFKTLQEAPSFAPKEVTADPIVPQTLQIRWKPLTEEDENVVELTGYQVLYRDLHGGTKLLKTIRGKRKHQATLTGLKHFTRYEIAVRAFNAIGHGPPSTPIISSTMEGVPEKPPQDLQCVPLSAQSVRIRWDSPPSKFHNGIIQGYKIIFKKVNASPNVLSPLGEKEVKKTSNLEIVLHGLGAYTNYSIKILAFTASGDGVPSSQIYCSTEEDVPGPPEQIKALVVTSDSILVTWLRPLVSNGIIIKYNIYFQGSNNDVQKELVFGDRTLMFECRRLKEFQHYEFWVSASTSVGEGMPSKKVSQSPISRVPARIASFSSQILGGEGSRITLSCYAVGLPAPVRLWRDSIGYNLPAEGSNFRILPDYSLIVSPLTQNSGGNYSCYAENVFGHDYVVYEIVVISVPQPPNLSVLGVTTDSIELQWKVTTEDSIYITGFILSYKGMEDEWQQFHLEADQRAYKLQKLRCGSPYQIFLQSSNHVGISKQSQVIKTATRGDVAGIAELNDFLIVNTTSVTIYLDSWPTNGCPILHFSMSYRAQQSTYWTVYGNNIPPNEEVIISDLTAASRYFLYMIAYTDAGPAKHEYVFITKSLNGEMILLDAIPEFSNTLLKHLNLIVPIVSGIFCTIAFSICICILVKRRMQYLGYKNTGHTKTLVELENQRNTTQQGHAYSPSPARKVTSSLSANKGSDTSGADYEICPYATFNLPAQPVGHSMKFQTFSQQDCYESQPTKEYHYTRSICKTGTSKSPPDGLSLEISCISSQQTLPIERKHGRDVKSVSCRSKRGTTSTFMSDSESSGGDKPQHVHRTPVRKHYTESTVFELDSSTESAEVSPEIIRRSVARHCVSSR